MPLFTGCYSGPWILRSVFSSSALAMDHRHPSTGLRMVTTGIHSIVLDPHTYTTWTQSQVFHRGWEIVARTASVDEWPRGLSRSLHSAGDGNGLRHQARLDVETLTSFYSAGLRAFVEGEFLLPGKFNSQMSEGASTRVSTRYLSQRTQSFFAHTRTLGSAFQKIYRV